MADGRDPLDIERPRPVADALSAGFWEASANRVLRIQRCVNCGYYQHPPQAICLECQSYDLRYEEVSGLGHLVEFTTVFAARHAAFQRAVPYVLAVVELVEQRGLNLFTNLAGFAEDELAAGMSVIVTFESIGQGTVLPQFTLRRPQDEPVGR